MLNSQHGNHWPNRAEGGCRFTTEIARGTFRTLPAAVAWLRLYNKSNATFMKTFYIETFGCQMNAHDSEKVIGTLVSEGYSQVEKVEEADLVLYNTCSIRDKAEQQVFHRLDQFKKK
jgi:hypothetical protein